MKCVESFVVEEQDRAPGMPVAPHLDPPQSRV